MAYVLVSVLYTTIVVLGVTKGHRRRVALVRAHRRVAALVAPIDRHHTVVCGRSKHRLVQP